MSQSAFRAARFARRVATLEQAVGACERRLVRFVAWVAKHPPEGEHAEWRARGDAQHTDALRAAVEQAKHDLADARRAAGEAATHEQGR